MIRVSDASAFNHMDVLRSIEFTNALVYLHKLIGSEVKVNVNVYGRFFGCGFEGVLTCVETLPPDHSAISLVLDGRQGFFLDPADTEAFVGGGEGTQPGLNSARPSVRRCLWNPTWRKTDRGRPCDETSSVQTWSDLIAVSRLDQLCVFS